MADKFEDLRNYVAIIDSGGINAAAASIGIAKSAVSRRLGELEQRLGTTLVHRSNRSFEPTAVGRRYYEGARDVLAALAALDEEASSGSSAAALRIAVAVEIPLAAAVAAAIATLPAADGVVATIVDAGAAGKDACADLTVGTEAPLGTGLKRLAAGSLGMSIVGSPARLDVEGRPSTFGDLRSMAGIATATREGGGWHFGEEGVHEPAVAMTVPDDASAVAAAVAGAGLARVPSILAALPVAEGRLEQVLSGREPAPEPVGVWIAKDADGAVRRLADQLAAALAAALG